MEKKLDLKIKIVRLAKSKSGSGQMYEKAALIDCSIRLLVELRAQPGSAARTVGMWPKSWPA